MSACQHTIIGICLTRAPVDTGYAVFGFSEFLAALALLVLVFSSSDFLYQFRISVSALPLKWLSFVAAATVGLGTLLTDLWFARQWYAPAWGVSRAALQGIFGALFVTTVLLWMWSAYMRPPIFGRSNYKHFYYALFRAVVRGSEAQLAALAGELVRSAEPLVKLWKPKTAKDGKPSGRTQDVSRFANDAILLLNNRKLCRHVVDSAPITAIVFMEEAAKQKRYSIPLGGFARNVTEEALKNRDSILFHEDSYGSDVLGMVQPFSTAMYGNYRLVEGIGAHFDSPLDIDWKLAWELDGPQFETYCRITFLTFKDYIKSGSYRSHSTALQRAFKIIQGAGRDIYKLDGQPIDATDSTPSRRMSAAAHFAKDVIQFLGEQPDLDFGLLRLRSDASGWYRKTIFDRIADLLFELIFDASAVKGPPDNAWWIHYNTVWGTIFTFQARTQAWKVIRFKVTRLLYDEIKRLEDLPNFKSARILGICLNVLGLSVAKGTHRDRSEYALRVSALNWTKKHYLRLRAVHPPVAEHCLIGGIGFDVDTNRLFKTYSQGLNLVPSREYLSLDFAEPAAGPFATVRRYVRRIRKVVEKGGKKESEQ